MLVSFSYVFLFLVILPLLLPDEMWECNECGQEWNETAIFYEDKIGKDFTEEKTDEVDRPCCPQCNSLNVDYEKFNRRLAFATWLIMSFPIPLLKRKWMCEDCGYQWRVR